MVYSEYTYVYVFAPLTGGLMAGLFAQMHKIAIMKTKFIENEIKKESTVNGLVDGTNEEQLLEGDGNSGV